MRRLLIVCITLAMLLSFAQTSETVFAETVNIFTDMPDDWSATALDKSVSNGLLKGTDGKIMPRQNLTRAQMAAVIERAFGATERSSLALYNDVSKSDWFYDSMAKAVFMEVFRGDGDKLNPNSNITREEAFVVIARSLKLSGASKNEINKFSDKESISEWALDSVASMVGAGYVSGSDGKINPKQYITRAEFAQVMDNILKNYIVKAGTYTDDLYGNVIINVSDVVLSNITVKGDLIIADGVGNGDVTLDNVTVTGRTVIRGGGINSIKITGKSNLQNIIIARVDGQVRVYATDGTEIGNVIADGNDDVIIEGTFGNIEVTAPDIIVKAISANIDSAVVSGENSKIIVAGDSNARRVILSSKNSSAEISGTVTKIQTTKDATNASITAAAGSKITNAEINSEGSTVSGNGNVASVNANADNIKVTTPNTGVTAGEGTYGVTAGGVAINEGQRVTVNNSGTGIVLPSSGSSSSPGSSDKKQLTISAPLLTLTKTYDGNNAANVVAGTLTGVDSGNTVAVSAAAYYDNAQSGTGKTITVEYTISGNDADKYTKPVNYVVATGEIIPIQLSVSTPTLTVSKEYDGSTTAAVSMGTLSGKISGDNLNVSISAAYDSNEIGNSKTITVSYALSGADAVNYVKPADYTVTNGEIKLKRLAISNPALTVTKAYDGTSSAAVTTGTLSGVINGESVIVNASAAYDDKDVKTGKTITVKYTISGTDSANYINPDDFTVTNGEITPAQLVISTPVLTLTKEYDGNSTAAVTKGILSGVVSGDSVTIDAVASYDNKDAGTGKTITVSYTVEGTDKENYAAPPDYTATGEITAKQLTISAPILTLSKEYDGNTSAEVSMGTLSGKMSGDDLDVSIAASYDSNEIGNSKTITVSYALSGADAGNYIKPSDHTAANGEIKAKQLTISAPVLTAAKVYDGSSTAAVTTGTLSGVADGESVTIDASASYDDKSAKTGKTITVKYTISGIDSTKYIKPEDFVVINGEITPVQLNISAPDLTLIKEYDGNAAVDMTKGTLSGAVSGDSVTVNASASYNNKNAGSGKTITVLYTIDGADKENYAAPHDYIVNTGQITAKQLTISPPSLTVSKEYDGNVSASATPGTLAGVASGDTVNVSAIAYYDDFNTGINKTITVVYTISGADAGNYIKPENYTVSNGVIVNKEQAAPSGLEGIAPTSSANNNGKITGTSAEMEYKILSEGTWNSATGSEITGLTSGTYEVRFKAKTGHNAGVSANVIVPEYVASLTSKSITKLDYSTTPATPAQLTSNAITSSDFTVNKVKFDIVDNEGNRIPVDLWWNVIGDFTPAQLVGSAIESAIQDWFYANKGGAAGIMNKTLYAMGIGDKVTIGTHGTGSSVSIRLYETGTTNQYSSYLFSNNYAVGTGGEPRSATFNISDGTSTATILLNRMYNNINSLVSHIATQISGAGVNASVAVNGADQFTVRGNNIRVGGVDWEIFFSESATQ